MPLRTGSSGEEPCPSLRQAIQSHELCLEMRLVMGRGPPSPPGNFRGTSVRCAARGSSTKRVMRWAGV